MGINALSANGMEIIHLARYILTIIYAVAYIEPG